MADLVVVNNGVDTGLHVLGNPYLTDIVCDYLTMNQVKQCRQVCSEWYAWFGGPLRRRQTVVLRTSGHFRRLLTHPDPDYPGCPYHRVVISYPLLMGRTADRMMERFWPVHSGLTELSLQNVEVCSVEILADVLFRQTPNLKKLVLRNCFNDKQGRDEFFKVDYTTPVTTTTGVETLELVNVASGIHVGYKLRIYAFMLQRYPQLKCLNLRGEFEYGDFNYLNEMLESLVPLVDANPESYRLKDLFLLDVFRFGTVRAGIPAAFVDTLRALNFPLETLTIDVGNSTAPAVLKELLSLYSRTLIKLEIIQSLQGLYFLNFPFRLPFINLKVFRLADNLAGTLHFLRYMPNLEILHLCAVEGRRFYFNNKLPHPDAHFHTQMLHFTSVRHMQGVRLQKLKELRFDYDITDKEIRRKLCVWMPHVEVLIIAALIKPEDTCRAILEGWPRLHTLSLRIGRRSKDKLLRKVPELKELDVLEIHSSSMPKSSDMEASLTCPTEIPLPHVSENR